MLGHASRILMAALVLYSCFEVKTNLTGSAADSITATAVRVLVAFQLLGSILFFAAPSLPPESHSLRLATIERLPPETARWRRAVR